MQVGDIVRHFLTEQIGIVLDMNNAQSSLAAVHVIWTTPGDSLCGPGTKEWCGRQSLEVLNESK